MKDENFQVPTSLPKIDLELNLKQMNGIKNRTKKEKEVLWVKPHFKGSFISVYVPNVVYAIYFTAFDKVTFIHKIQYC